MVVAVLLLLAATLHCLLALALALLLPPRCMLHHQKHTVRVLQLRLRLLWRCRFQRSSRCTWKAPWAPWGRLMSW